VTFVIAIDGLAGAGKSTLGEAIARDLGCGYVDTGLMYRAVTLAALQKDIAPSDELALGQIADQLDFRLDTATNSLYIAGAQPVPELHSAAVDRAISEVSAHPAVRSALTARQRQLAAGQCVVMVGRDIGTVVFPRAPVKLWVTASEETRAARRAAERREGTETEQRGVAYDLAVRDRLDSGRAVAPARRPADAVVIDTDRLGPAAALAESLEAIGSARAPKR